MKILKPGLYFTGIYIFDIKGYDGEDYDVDIYTLRLIKGETFLASRKVPYSNFENIAPYSNVIKLDRDSMQGLILGIFGETV